MPTWKILYAEDSPMIAELTGKILLNAGYSLVQCGDGEQAFQAFQSAPREFDLLLTDHDMPRMKGCQLVKALRAEGFQGPVIVNSGSLTSEMKAPYESLGVTDFVAKPARPAELIARVQAACAAVPP